MLKITALNRITEKIIGCAIEVHRHLGPGLLESIYEKALCFQLKQYGLKRQEPATIPIPYKGHILGEQGVDVWSKMK